MGEYAISALPLSSIPGEHFQHCHDIALPYLERLTHFGTAQVVIDEDGRTFTPRKILRRVLDHMIDHLNQIEQWIVWQSSAVTPIPADGWIGSAETLPEDLFVLTDRELSAWLWRIDIMVQTIVKRLANITSEQQHWPPPDGGWSIYTIIYHLAWAHVYYATALENALPQDTRERFMTAAAILSQRLDALSTGTQNEVRVFLDEQFFTPMDFISKLIAEQDVLLSQS